MDRFKMLIALIALSATAGCATGSDAGADQPPAEQTAQPAADDAAADEAAAEEAAAEATGAAGGAKADDTSRQGLDARLTNYAYPYPVETFEVVNQGEALEMAYMDVAPADVEGAAEPTGRTVVLLHGKNFSGAYWGQTIDALAKRGYRVVVPDQIGFGKSSKPTELQYSFQLLASNTRKLLDELGVDTDVTIVGHSMGGMLATRLALMYPELADQLALVNPIGLEDWKRKVPYQTVDEWTAREIDKTPEQIREYMKASYFDGQWKPMYDQLAAIQTGWVQGPDWDRLARVSALTYDMIFTQPVVYEFGLVAQPTLLIIGQRDRTALGKNLVEPEVAETLGQYHQLGREAAGAIPNARLVEFDAIGHIPQYEAPERYIEALTGFIAGEEVGVAGDQTAGQ